MKTTPTQLALWSTLTLSLLMCSCGLIDFEFEEYTQEVFEMNLNRDSVYVLLDEPFNLTPVFTPDSVSNKEVYWTSSDNTIVWVFDNVLLPVGVGEAYVTALTVLNRMTDSCYVKVLPHWEIDIHNFSDDMVVYADVSINGAPVDTENILLGAFCGGELRGVGVKKEAKGIEYFEFHIMGYKELENDENGNNEIVRFAYYDRSNLSFKYLSQYLIFDGETHGTLSDLYVIDDK